MDAWLETISGEKITLKGNCSLGRHPSCNVVLKDDQVSRRHSLIHIQGQGERWLVDLGSSNGTLLNGRRVRLPVALKDKDRLELGSEVLVFRQNAFVAATPPMEEESDCDMTIKASVTTSHWLLVADIEKFTPLSQTMPGDELARLVGKWISSCKEIIEMNGGEINKYLGDGFLAYWPSTETTPETIDRTLAQLKKIQASGPMKFRLVVHHGAITLDNSLSQGENSLIGPNVNFIFRMEKVAGGLGKYCVLSEAAARHLEKHGLVEPLGEHPLSGFSGNHPLYLY